MLHWIDVKLRWEDSYIDCGKKSSAETTLCEHSFASYSTPLLAFSFYIWKTVTYSTPLY